jgi:ribosomal protein S18 acetylase RimI-like enzyme
VDTEGEYREQVVLPEPVKKRKLREEDFDALRNLLVDTLRITPPGFNWDVRRIDGRKYHNRECRLEASFLRGSAVWTIASGAIVAAVHPESRGDAHIQIHPDFRALEPEMIRHACQYLAIEREGRKQLFIETMEYDVGRVGNLRIAGFEATEGKTAFRRMRFGRQPIRDPKISPEYRLRTTRCCESEDCQRIADILNAAFGRTSHTGVELEVFHANAPSFRSDLDLVAEASDASFGAYVGIAYDGATGQAILEPVCTHPDHRRRGLAATLMLEGLHRLNARGAIDVVVGTGDAVAANKLYESVGFTETYLGRRWIWTK